MEHVYQFYSKELKIRLAAVISTETVGKMHTIQKTFPLATIIQGQAVTGAALMATQLKEEGDKLGLHFQGNGPLKWLFAEAHYNMRVRGCCANGKADLRTKDGHLDLRGGLGIGLLTVERSMPFQKQPGQGIVTLTGSVSQDLTHYLYQSHQIPSVVSLTVSLDKNGKVKGAGGVLWEIMEGAPDSTVKLLEERASTAPPLSKTIKTAKNPIDLILPYTKDALLTTFKHPHPISFSCRCSLERVHRALKLTGKSELSELVLKGDAVEVTCEFCGMEFVVEVDTLRKLLKRAQL